MVNTDHPVYRTLRKIYREAKKVSKEIKQVMNDEECGYTVNRVTESMSLSSFIPRFRSMIDTLTSKFQSSVQDVQNVFFP